MSIYYHIGSSGAGKTTEVQKRIISEAEIAPERTFLFVVPEQFTLQTQREILEKSGSGGMMNIDALSFARLAHRVFEEQGVTLPQVLEDTGKSMIVKKVIQEHKDELTIYRSKVKKQGFVEEMKSLIAEFYQYGINSARIKEMQKTAGDRKILQSKLHDIEVIYEAFKKFIDGRFVMNEEILDRMCEIAGESGLLRNAVVVFDGFTGFTPSQYNCIDQLMKYASDIHVILTLDPENRLQPGHMKEGNLFELSLKTIDKLERLAVKNNLGSEFMVCNAGKGRYRDNPSMAHLERNIFRFPYKKSKDYSAVTLLSASDTDEEAEFVVAKIRELIFGDKEKDSEEMRYQDIAVLTGDLSSYGAVLAHKLLKAGIPYFIDEKKSIVGLSAVELIDSAMDIILSDFSYESVFRFLKTGLSGIEPDNISLTENYVIEKGIKGYRRWKSEWKLPEDDVRNITRAAFMDLLDEYRKTEVSEQIPTVTERLTALYNILDRCDVEIKLFNTSEVLKESVNPKERIKGIELGQLFGSIVAVFERINSLLGNDRMPLAEFKEVLDTGFSEAKLRSIPGGVDSIVVGDMERTRIDNKRVIFFVGCNDGVLPGSSTKVSLLNEFDRELFAENDIELSPTKRENVTLKEFYLYLALTKPSDKLFISYSKKTGESQEARPAYIFGRIMKLFEGLQVQKLSDFESDNIFRIIGCDMGLGSVIEKLRTENISVREDDDGQPADIRSQASMILESIFKSENEELVRIIREASKGRKNSSGLSKEDAEKLYGNIIIGSITRLQQFAQCAFSHFAKYGLKLQERKEYRLGGIELGSIYHKALETYAAGLKKDRIRWSEVSEDEKKERKKKAVEASLADYEDIVSSSKRYEYVRKSLTRVFSKTVDIVTGQIAAGRFDVGSVEQFFSHESTYMKLTGVIDRVDVVKKNGKTYFRIIDYKTGNTVFNIEKMKAGLQLQLAIYTAEAAAELALKEENPVPTGMYYYRIDDPVLEVKPGSVSIGETDVNNEKEVMKILRLDGITVDENDIIGLHDSALISDKGERLPGSSVVINYECKKDGTLAKNSEKSVIEPDEFTHISNEATFLAGKLAKDILEGNVSVDPYEYKQENACRYCIYRSVCKFDKHLGDRFRKI